MIIKIIKKYLPELNCDVENIQFDKINNKKILNK